MSESIRAEAPAALASVCRKRRMGCAGARFRFGSMCPPDVRNSCPLTSKAQPIPKVWRRSFFGFDGDDGDVITLARLADEGLQVVANVVDDLLR